MENSACHSLLRWKMIMLVNSQLEYGACSGPPADVFKYNDPRLQVHHQHRLQLLLRPGELLLRRRHKPVRDCAGGRDGGTSVPPPPNLSPSLHGAQPPPPQHTFWRTRATPLIFFTRRLNAHKNTRFAKFLTDAYTFIVRALIPCFYTVEMSSRFCPYTVIHLNPIFKCGENNIWRPSAARELKCCFHHQISPGYCVISPTWPHLYTQVCCISSNKRPPSIKRPLRVRYLKKSTISAPKKIKSSLGPPSAKAK